MKDIEHFYVLAYNYGFIGFEKYIQIVLGLTVSAVRMTHEGSRQPTREYESKLFAKVG